MVLRALLVGGMLAVWGLALSYWSQLPASMPMNFGMTGTPGGFVDTSVWSWFLMPAMATAFAIGFGFVMPGWMRGQAERNSPMLNMPDGARFRALSTEARVRVMAATMRPLMVMGIVLQALFGWLVHSSGQVALGHWRTLPMTPVLAAVGAVVVCAVWLVGVSKRAVGREAGPSTGE